MNEVRSEADPHRDAARQVPNRYLRWIEISGFRGFAQAGRIHLGIPEEERAGSGMTILVGPNNGGKSTVIEALRAMSKPSPQSFSEGKRNALAASRLSIRLCNSQGEMKELRTIEAGGSQTEWINQSTWPSASDLFVLPSRRHFSPFFNRMTLDRAGFITSYDLPPVRTQPLDHFSGRLFKLQEDPDARSGFMATLSQVLDPLPEWRIELADSGQYYLQFNFAGQCHNSDGSGDGLLSLFLIVDALYDSKPGDIIAVDEPELSLHPSVQRKLATLLADYAKTRQIVVATHSPYFIDWRWILEGARIARVVRESGGSVVHCVSPESAKLLKGFVDNINNPHILGLDAREVFFLHDRVILVEGQEDVVVYQRIVEELDIDLVGTFYGWGVGGAGNMEAIATILKELGFEKIVGVLDRNKQDTCDSLSSQFPEYKFMVIPADNVRSKRAREAVPPVAGLTDENGHVRNECKGDVERVIREINAFLTS